MHQVTDISVTNKMLIYIDSPAQVCTVVLEIVELNNGFAKTIELKPFRSKLHIYVS